MDSDELFFDFFLSTVIGCLLLWFFESIALNSNFSWLRFVFNETGVKGDDGSIGQIFDAPSNPFHVILELWECILDEIFCIVLNNVNCLIKFITFLWEGKTDVEGLWHSGICNE